MALGSLILTLKNEKCLHKAAEFLIHCPGQSPRGELFLSREALASSLAYGRDGQEHGGPGERMVGDQEGLGTVLGKGD